MKMPTNYKRKGTSGRGEWSKVNLKNAMKAVEEKKMSVNNAAKVFDIPRTTLKRRIKNQDSSKGSLGPPSILGVANEKRIVAQIKRLQSQGITPCRDIVRSMAFEIAEKLKIPHNFNKETRRAGYDWLRSFLVRNPSVSIKKEKLTDVSASKKDVTITRVSRKKENTAEEFSKLLEVILNEDSALEKYDDVFNENETRLEPKNTSGEGTNTGSSKNVVLIPNNHNE